MTLNARDLAKLLKPYGVTSMDVKLDGTNRKGYRREQLHDPWTRYLPPADGGSATSATSATAQVNDGDAVAGSGQEALPATSTMALTSGVAEVAQVADTPPDGGLESAVALVRDKLGGVAICPNCRETEDSSWHATLCLGHDAP